MKLATTTDCNRMIDYNYKYNAASLLSMAIKLNYLTL